MTKIKVVLGRDKDKKGQFTKKFPAGTCIFQEGDLGFEMFVIREGSVEIRKNIGGKEKVLSVLEKGDFFGEMALIEGLPRSASAYAISDVEAVAIDEAAFENLLTQNPEIALRMLRKLSRKLRYTTELLQDMTGRRISVEVPPEQKPSPSDQPAKYHLVEESSGATFALASGKEILIGRKDPVTGIVPDVDLSKVDTKRSVSRRHARIIFKGDQMYLQEEMGTVNGTFINETRLDKGKPYPFKEGDTVKFGLVVLKVVAAKG